MNYIPVESCTGATLFQCGPRFHEPTPPSHPSMRKSQRSPLRVESPEGQETGTGDAYQGVPLFGKVLSSGDQTWQ